MKSGLTDYGFDIRVSGLTLWNSVSEFKNQFITKRVWLLKLYYK